MSGFNTACKAALLKLTQLEDSEMLSVSQKPRFHANAAIYEKGLYVNNRMQSSLTEFKIDVRLRLHTVINRVDFVSWCMLYTYEGNKMHSWENDAVLSWVKH